MSVLYSFLVLDILLVFKSPFSYRKLYKGLFNLHWTVVKGVFLLLETCTYDFGTLEYEHFFIERSELLLDCMNYVVLHYTQNNQDRSNGENIAIGFCCLIAKFEFKLKVDSQVLFIFS